jgi:flagellar hook assembly protein FlgD
VDLTDVASPKNARFIPKKWEVLQNYPNPFNPETKITIRVPNKQFVRADIYNTVGQLVYTLTKKVMPPGEYTFSWKRCDTNGSAVPSGLYFLHVVGKKYSHTQKMILMR